MPMSALAEPVTHDVRIAAGRETLAGILARPSKAAGVVIFAHGSGSGRHSPRNAQVADAINDAGFATLLFDLLTPEEERVDRVTRELRFDIGLLSRRLKETTAWVRGQPPLAGLPLGYFGASTGSAAALVAAADLGRVVRAVVSRGGRPDLAGAAALSRVEAATMLIVGGLDDAVLDLNRRAFASLRGPKDLAVVDGATHLFEEPGTLDRVATLAARWFALHLAPAAPSGAR
jgi:dienelactone hydrolase